MAVLTIATNKYINYWKAMALSLDRNLSGNNDITFYVHTDRPREISEFSSTLVHSKVKITEIPGWKWPEVALRRYETINNAIPGIDQEFLIYIDADMIALSEIPSVTEILGNLPIALTYHPGFWRPKNLNKVLLYLSHPILAIRDLRMNLAIGGLGAWETNKQSTSFVSRKDRKFYVCGGFWLGKKAEIQHLAQELMAQTNQDSEKRIEAKWLDESHLNSWAVNHAGKFGILTPEYCFDRTYSQLAKLSPKIEAVDKANNPVEDPNVP